MCLYNAITSTLWTVASVYSQVPVYTEKQMGLVGAFAFVCKPFLQHRAGGIACLKVAEQPVAGAFDPKSDVTLANLLHATCFNSMWQPPNLL